MGINVPVPAKPTASRVTIDGRQIDFKAFTIEDSNYFRLRDLAIALSGTDKQFQVEWDSTGNAVKLTSKTAYTPAGNVLTVSDGQKSIEAKRAKAKFYIDGREIRLNSYTIGGSNYFRLRDLAQLFDFRVTWDGKLNMIGIDTSTGYSG